MQESRGAEGLHPDEAPSKFEGSPELNEAREEYRDDVRSSGHALLLADYLESLPVSRPEWPVVNLGRVLPSARDMIVRALREYAKTLPTE